MICKGCTVIRPPKFDPPGKPDWSKLLEQVRRVLDRIEKVKFDPFAKDLMDKACQAAVKRLHDEFGAELQQISLFLKKRMAPFDKEMQRFLLGLQGKEGDDAINYVLEELLKYLKQIDQDEMVEALEELFEELLEKITSLANSLFDDVIEPAMDEMTEWLESDWLESNELNSIVTSDAFNRFLLAKDLKQLKDKLKKEAGNLPQFTKAAWFDPLVELIRNSVYLGNWEKVGEVGDEAKDILGKWLDLAKSISGSNTAPDGGPGRHLWYASWITGESHWEIDDKIVKGPLFKLDADETANLAGNQNLSIDALSRFSKNEFPLTGTIVTQEEVAGEKWIVSDDDGQRFYITRKSTAAKASVFYLYQETDWRHIPPLSNYTFKTIQPELADSWAFHSSWLADWLKALLHSINMKPTKKTGARSNAFSNLANAAIHFTYMNLKMGGPAGFKRKQNDRNLESFRLKKTLPLAATLIASLEGSHKNNAGHNKGARTNYWIHEAGVDFTEKQLFDYWVGLLHEGFLSYITLLNYSGPTEAPVAPVPDTRPLNRSKMAGLSAVFSEFATWATVAVLPGRDYGFPQGSNPDQIYRLVVHWLGIGTVAGAFASIMGLKAAENIAGANDPKQWCKGLRTGIGNTWAKFPLYLYLANEGATNYGRLSHAGAPMPGYPEADGSPYKLPFEKDNVYQCVQGNRGLWGHNHIGDDSALYAYDFALDYGDRVLAARPGILWAFADAVDPDESRGCYVQILHGDLPDEKHDRNQAKKEVRTMAEYRHGIPGSIVAALATGGSSIEMKPADQLNASVQTAFQQEGIELSKLGNMPVAVKTSGGVPAGPVVIEQGDQIMLAGVSGLVVFNHLHFQVQPAMHDPDGDVTGIEAYTIPVVFAEVKAGLWSRAGVPRARHFYQSANGA
jgi:hypothetical protein